MPTPADLCAHCGASRLEHIDQVCPTCTVEDITFFIAPVQSTPTEEEE